MNAPLTPEPKRGPLWSLLDWSLWGAGMGDTFREPLADTMLGAVPAETVAQAEAVMAEFIERRKIEKTGVTVYQEQRDEIEQLRTRVAELEGDLNAGVNAAVRNALEGSAVRRARAEAWREAADALEERVADVDVDTRTTWAGMDAAYLRHMADQIEAGTPAS